MGVGWSRGGARRHIVSGIMSMMNGRPGRGRPLVGITCDLSVDRLEAAGLLIHAWVDGQLGGVLTWGSHPAGGVASTGFYLVIRLWS